MSQKIQNQTLFLRQASLQDVDGICALSAKLYGKHDAYSPKMVRSHIAHFPEGQLVAEYDGTIVGHAATFITESRLARKPHTWRGITGGGYASRHKEDGDILYGMEIGVDPDTRGMRIGQRLYNMRKKLCVSLKLRGIIFGGRIPGYARQKKKNPELTPEGYIEAVEAKEMRDLVLGFQLRNGFHSIGVLKNYLPEDRESGGNASHMYWENAIFEEPRAASYSSRPAGSVRVASVQFQVRKVSNFEDFIIRWSISLTSPRTTRLILWSFPSYSPCRCSRPTRRSTHPKKPSATSPTTPTAMSRQ